MNASIHQGKRLSELIKLKGYNANSLSKIIGKTRQTIDYHVDRQYIKKEILSEYAKALNVDIEEFSKVYAEENQINDNSQNWKEKYFDLLEESKALWQVVAQHGIKVDLRNFNLGGLSSAFGDAYFFIGSTQKATHP